MVFKFYLVDNDEIVIFAYENISASTLDILDRFVKECDCDRDNNIITGDPSDLMDLLMAVSKSYDILL